MRVVFLAPSAYPLGGVQTWLNYLLPGLEAEGFEPVLALVEGDRHDPVSYTAMHPCNRTVQITPRQFTPSARSRAIAEALDDLAPEVVVGVNIADLYPASADLAARGRAPRIVATQHALAPDYFADFALFWDSIDAVICTNRLAARLCGSLSGFESERVLYAPYGVQQTGAPERAERQNGGDDTFRIGYAGRLEEPQKRASDLPGILSALVAKGIAAELIIAGRGPLEEELRASLEAYRLAERVHFLGHVPSSELSDAFYRQIDALLVTSSWETGPIVAWEAMAQQVPVASSAYVGSISEGALIDNVNCRLFPVGDIAAAAQALESLMVPETRARLIAGGSELVKHRYSRAASIRRWAEALEQVVALPARDRHTARYRLDAPGRLQRFVGSIAADWIRENILPRRPVASAGAEWPHAYSRHDADETFLRRLEEQERHGA